MGGVTVLFEREEKRWSYRFIALASAVINDFFGRFGIHVRYSVICERKLFLEVGGFNDVVCEDLELFSRLRYLKVRYKSYKGLIAITSSRRFRKYGTLRIMLLWVFLGILYYFF